MNLTYLLRYLSKLTVYKSVPVYNLNWLNSKQFYRTLIKNSTITLVDVGARSGSAEELGPLEDCITYIGFDADAKEVERLHSKTAKYYTARYIPSFVSNQKGQVKFNLHYNAGNSSVYDFSKSYSRWYRSDQKNPVESVLTLNSDCLDNLISEDVDVIKLDTQGNEFEILGGASKCLNDALMVEIEVEFVQMYEKQKLAHDVMTKMYDSGFELLYLNRVFKSSAEFKGISRGQMIFGDALFGVSRDKALTLSAEKQKKYCALLINYGHLDFAFDIYKESPRLQEHCRELGLFFDRINRRPSNFTRVAKILIDKIVYVLLHIRRTNGLSNDSDRSWPIR